MAEENIKIGVEVNADSAVSNLQRIAEATEKVASTMESASQKTGAAESKITTFNQSLQAGIAVFNLAGQALQKIGEVLERADKFGDAAEQFDKLTQSAGVLGDTFLNKLSKAAGDTIDNLDLMLAANKALTAGLDPSTFDEVVRAAKAYADANGIDAKTAIDKFTIAISKGNENLLQTLGIYKDGKIALEEFTDAQAALSPKVTTLSGVYEILKKRTTDALDAFLQWGDKALFDILLKLGSYIEDKVTRAVEYLTSTINDLTTGFKVLGEIVSSLSNGELPDLDKIYLKIGKEQAALIKNQKAQNVETKNQIEVVGKANEVLVKFGQNSDATGAAAARAADKIEEMREKIFDVTKLEEDVAKEASQLTLKPGATVFDSILSNVLGLPDPRGTVGEAEDSAKEAKKRATDLIASIIGDVTQQGFAALKDFKVTKQETAGFFSAIGAALGAAGVTAAGAPELAPIGAAVGQGVVEQITDFFLRGGNAQTEARKSIDKFTSDLFSTERLRVIIGGNLQDAFDFSFQQDFTGGTFDDAFNSLSINAKNAFTAIGVGLQQIQGLNEDVFGQIASVFAENLGNSLNNLQIAVDALGISFEDLTKSILDAGDQGKLSFLEIQGALAGVQQISQRGIPDAVGATIQAFQNLQAAGIRGGRVSVDALGDIGAEALQLGLDTLPQLQAQLTSTGQLVPSEVQKIFDALAKFGVGSLEQLRDVSRETAFAILADAEAQGFAFAETANQVGDLVSQVLDLPNEKNITINVRTNADSASRQVLALVRDEERRTPIGIPSV